VVVPVARRRRPSPDVVEAVARVAAGREGVREEVFYMKRILCWMFGHRWFDVSREPSGAMGRMTIGDGETAWLLGERVVEGCRCGATRTSDRWTWGAA
jgi:hypothetical protein